MTSTPNARTASAARVAGFLALLAAGAALLVLFAAAAHAALSAAPQTAEHAAGMHRPGAAPHLRQQRSGLHKGAARHGRPGHQASAHAAADFRSTEMRPAHAPQTQLAAVRWNHKCAGAARVRAARHGHAQSNPDHVWWL